jgi:tryptophan synthase alpha chain
VIARGAPAVARCLADAGASSRGRSGTIRPRAPAVLEACDASGIALVPLVAPTTPDERLALIGERARGFIYTVSVTGTTGERQADADVAAIVARAKASTSVPVALGFGISTPEQAAHAADQGADGVIIGSRLVRAAAEAHGDPAPAVRELVEGFAAALRDGGPGQ